MKCIQILLVVFLFNSCINSSSEKNSHQKQTTGPVNGSLILVGGYLSDSSIYQKFMKLSGGPDAPIVLILTAASDDLLNDGKYVIETEMHFREQGFNNITLIHTRDPHIANTDSFTNPIKNARGLWFIGGRQWRLVDAYMNTKTLDEFNNLLERGGVIGGSSAGATIQGSYLVRGDTKTNTIMMGDHEDGFGFIKNIAVDQHLLAMNRQYDIFEILEAKPELLGIGLDENTAIVVQGNEFEVIGKHYVAVYDGTFFTEIRDKEDWKKIRYEQNPLPKGSRKFYLLKKGQRYNMLERKIIP